jgi:response regulator RpfG family c-di-GMP phosphodiesterase
LQPENLPDYQFSVSSSFSGADWMKILLVDDNPSIVESLFQVLNEEGYQVVTAGDGLEALKILHQHNFDLVLTDLNMPRLNGMDLVSEIRKMRNAPLVIIITAYATMETAIYSVKLGVYDYLLKPFNMDQVLHAVSRALEKRRLEQENMQLKEMIVLYNASEAISSSLDISAIIDVLLDASFSQSQADLAVLYLLEDDRQTLRMAQHKCAGCAELECAEFLQSLAREVDASRLGSIFDGQGSHVFNPGNATVAPMLRTPSTEHQFYSLLSISLKANNRYIGMLNLFSLTPGVVFSDKHSRALYILAAKGASAIENAHLYENTQQYYLQTIKSFAHALEAKDKYTHGHSQQVTRYAEVLAKGLDLDPRQVNLLLQAAMLHDIGKIGISESILNKPGALTEKEYQVVKKHPVTGKHILAPITSLAAIVPVVYHHHERWDGAGYPDGLKAIQIPLSARILAIADAFDAMTSSRAYRQAMDVPGAFRELERSAGTQFDPELVEVFCRQQHIINGLMQF